MANHRWDTEPPAALPSRLAVRRLAAGQPNRQQRSRSPYQDDFLGSREEDAWALPGRDGSAAHVGDAGAAGAEPGDEGFDDGFDDAGRPEARRPRRRWGFPLRAGILAACLMLAAAVAVPLLRDRGPVLAVELDSSPAAEATGEGAPAGSGHPDNEASPTAVEPTAAGNPGSPEERAGANGLHAGAAGGELVVHVAGAVAAPGLVRIPAGARVADAVSGAGGATGEADLTRVNLAAPMTDGSMVVIPAKGDPAVPLGPSGAVGAEQPAGSAGSSAAGTSGGETAVNLNTAGETELQTLPRVGPVLAARIVAWRAEHGPFQRPEDLDAVPGIGEAMLAALLPLVAV